LIAIAFSGGFTIYSAYIRLVLHRSPQGFAALITIVTFLSGVQLLFLGVIGEYIGRVFEELKARPIYVVAKVIRGAKNRATDEIEAEFADASMALTEATSRR
jgi:polyisoprenyl-phosphate glycosyltransferase